MKKVLIIKSLSLITCILFTNLCFSKTPSLFVIQHRLSSVVTFNFKKEYSTTVGTIRFLNQENIKKKWRYILHAPLACLYNKQTRQCDRSAGQALITYNPDPTKLDSIFWALLDSATTHIPVKPYGSTQITVYLNLNAYPKPKKLIHLIKHHHKNLEYHIFFRTGAASKNTLNRSPDFIVKDIQVIP